MINEFGTLRYLTIEAHSFILLFLGGLKSIHDQIYRFSIYFYFFIFESFCEIVDVADISMEFFNCKCKFKLHFEVTSTLSVRKLIRIYENIQYYNNRKSEKSDYIIIHSVANLEHKIPSTLLRENLACREVIRTLNQICWSPCYDIPLISHNVNING